MKQECSQLCFYTHCLLVSVVPPCLLNPPQIPLFFFPPGVQNVAAPMVAAPKSKQGQGFSQRAPPRCCHGGASHSVLCRCEMTAA